MTVVLVCGGRNYGNRDNVFASLDALSEIYQFECVIHGDCNRRKKTGADYFASEWAKANGIIPRDFPADWDKYGKAAGPIRNTQMIVEGRPDLAVAFPGNKGTADMVAKAMAAAVPVICVSDEGVLS